mmetsp:Transcript_10265/g.29194  ORF Transcript_10265/g.29194 Transcript_10265/m.29194 type:complete len:177 (-) Transcript_10265:243-773(-)
MDIKIQPGYRLSRDQKEVMSKAFQFVASHPSYTEGATIGRNCKPPLLPADAPRLFRACGQALRKEDEVAIMDDIPEEGIDFKQFCALFEKHFHEKPQASEEELSAALGALDITGQGSLDPHMLTEFLTTFGEGLPAEDVEIIVGALPRDQLGRVSCSELATMLVRGPVGTQNPPQD